MTRVCGAKRLGLKIEAKRLGGKRPGGKRLGGETSYRQLWFCQEDCPLNDVTVYLGLTS